MAKRPKKKNLGRAVVKGVATGVAIGAGLGIAKKVAGNPHRTFNGKRFKLMSRHRKKSTAKLESKWHRSEGWKSRVIKLKPKVYAVYTRTPKMK
jgi:hypothetical protein